MPELQRPEPTQCATLIECGRLILERDQLAAQLDKAIAERDEAIAERDFLLNFLQDMGMAVNRCRGVSFNPTVRGVEIRSLYRSHAEALIVATHFRNLRAMVCIGMPNLPGADQAMAACAARAVVEQPM